MAEPAGEYVQNGDILEWRWNKGHEPDKFVGVKPDFDPTSAPAVESSVAEGNLPKPEEEPAPKKTTKK